MAETERLHTLITGASSGIGQEIALRLSEQHRLIIHGRDLQRLEDTRRRCVNPDQHLIWSYDLRNVDHLAEHLSALMAEHGITLDAFVHSAALLKILPVRSVNHTAFNEVLNVNVVSALEIVSLLAKKRVNRHQLRNIVFISTVASNFGAPGFSTYSASKSALDGLMRALAVELAPVRVNSILPGGIRTPMTERLLADGDIMTKLVKDYPLGIGEAVDVVNMVEFLLSARARWITGQQIVIDGGRSINISI